MSYFNNFERLFMERSLELVDSYRGEYETTLLLNCLVGLLLFPNERFIDQIPDRSLHELSFWGLQADCITSAGGEKNPSELSLRDIVRRLRNSVAHCRIEPYPNDHRLCEGFKFYDRNGFSAQIPADQIKALLMNLLHYLLRK